MACSRCRFRKVFQYEVWPGVVEQVMLKMSPGNSPVQVVWKDLVIRAESLPDWTGGPPPPTPGLPKWVWMVGALSIVLVLPTRSG